MLFSQRINADVAGGQALHLAQVQSGFVRAAEEAGRDVEEAYRLSQEFLDAVGRGDTSAQARIVSIYDQWRLEAAQAAAEQQATIREEEERRVTGANIARDMSVEALRELEAAGLEVYERLGAAVEGWAARTQASIDRVAAAARSLAAAVGAREAAAEAAGGDRELTVRVEPQSMAEVVSVSQRKVRRDRGAG